MWTLHFRWCVFFLRCPQIERPCWFFSRPMVTLGHDETHMGQTYSNYLHCHERNNTRCHWLSLWSILDCCESEPLDLARRSLAYVTKIMLSVGHAGSGSLVSGENRFFLMSLKTLFHCHLLSPMWNMGGEWLAINTLLIYWWYSWGC